MFKINFLLIFSLLFCFVFLGIKVDAQNQNFYTNKEYGFKIEFPQNWKMEGGFKDHTIQKATKESSTVMVAVWDLIEMEPFDKIENLFEKNVLSNLNIDDLSNQEIEGLAQALKDSFVEQRMEDQEYLEALNLENGMRKLDSQKAIYFKFLISARFFGEEIKLVSVSYSTIYNGKFYTVSGSALENDFTKTQSIIESSIKSFSFTENSAESGLSIHRTDSDFWGSFTPANLIINFILTWCIGLTPPFLIRYKIAKKPLSKNVAIIVSAVFYFINILIFVGVFQSQNKSHGVLALISFISYGILREDNKKKAQEEKKQGTGEENKIYRIPVKMID